MLCSYIEYLEGLSVLDNVGGGGNYLAVFPPDYRRPVIDLKLHGIIVLFFLIKYLFIQDKMLLHFFFDFWCSISLRDLSYHFWSVTLYSHDTAETWSYLSYLFCDLRFLASFPAIPTNNVSLDPLCIHSTSFWEQRTRRKVYSQSSE